MFYLKSQEMEKFQVQHLSKCTLFYVLVQTFKLVFVWGGFFPVFCLTRTLTFIRDLISWDEPTGYCVAE